MAELVAVPDAAPAELDARTKRKAREASRRAKLEAAAARRADRATAKRAELEAKDDPPAPDAPPVVERSDAERGEDLASMLAGVLWPVLGMLLGVFGFTLAPLSDAEAKRDALAWIPVARRYRWLDLAATWAAAPARIVARVREKIARKAKPDAAAAALPTASPETRAA